MLFGIRVENQSGKSVKYSDRENIRLILYSG